MSRTNPYKKKLSSPRKTLLFFGEGQSEELFLRHLRQLYSFNKGVLITIRKGQGSIADRIVVEADNFHGNFHRKIVVLDNDKPEKEMTRARKEAELRKIELIENTPCLEALLLSILCPDRNFRYKESAWCKKEFESKYLDRKKRTDLGEYERLFTRQLLDERGEKVRDLNRLIVIMKGK
jgi:hypothetical protein